MSASPDAQPGHPRAGGMLRGAVLSGPPRLLLIEEDRALTEQIEAGCRTERIEVVAARSGAEGLQLWRRGGFHLVLLDMNLADMSGLEICRALRNESSVGIMAVSARARELDKILALEMGADDYVTKPFSLPELLARVKALLRRATLPVDTPEEVYHAGGVIVDVDRRQVIRDGEPVFLRPKQFSLLHILIANRGRVIPRQRLMDEVWSEREHADDGTLEVHIRWLRQNIERDPARPQRILTVRGVGYRYAPDAP